MVLIVLAALPASGVRADDPPSFSGLGRQFTLIEPVAPAPLHPIRDGAGETLDLSAFRGKVVLLNFWATWCAPCVRELPALDRLQADLGGDDFAVVALSIDRGGLKKIRPFLTDLGINHLTPYLDDTRESFRAFGVRGLPSSYVIDRQGKLVGYLEGPAEWDSDASKALMQHYIDKPDSPS